MMHVKQIPRETTPGFMGKLFVSLLFYWAACNFHLKPNTFFPPVSAMTSKIMQMIILLACTQMVDCQAQLLS